MNTKGSPLAKLAPHFLKEVGGFKSGSLARSRRGCQVGSNPRILREIEALDPLEPARASIRVLRDAGAQAIILAGHMGFKAPNFCRDDFANRVSDLTQSCPEIDVFIGAHTHKDVPTAEINRKLYTQANYYGIHLGRVDLTFQIETGRLIDKRAFTILMDDRFDLDPAALSLAKDDLDLSKKELDKPIGTVTEALSATSGPGRPSDQQLLIGLAIREALARKNITVDGVVHGSFSEDVIDAGPKTAADVWDFMPYENFLVSGELNPEELVAVLEEGYAAEKAGRNLLGFVTRTDDAKNVAKVAEILDRAGRPLPRDKRYRIAFNSYDAQSGGQRLPKLKEILQRPVAKTQFHDVETRDAVIECFLQHKTISPQMLLGA